MTSRFIHPFFDVGSGLTPSDGAKLTFKNPGLETLKDTFSDSDGLIANTNPVIADATGLFSNIYIKGNYDVVLQDKNSVQIWADSISEFALVADSETVKNVPTLASAVANTDLLDGDALNLAERTVGVVGSGGMWDVVLSSTVTENTFNIVQCTGVPTLSLVLRLENGVVYVDQFGAVGDFTTDSTLAIVQAWNTAPFGGKVMYGQGIYKFTSGQTHPDKQLHHYGVGRTPGLLASAANADRGTGLAFTSVTGIANGGIYMAPPSLVDGQLFSRFSSFNDMTFLGDGTTDSNGTNNGLKINNQGTHLNRVNFRYFLDGIEVNYSVSQAWDNVTSTCARYSVRHRFDPANPFNAVDNSVATLNTYNNISVNTSKTNAVAIGWYVDATCQYALNNHGGAFDAEQCFTGVTIEGRITSKDAVSGSALAFGAAAFQGIGNLFDTFWTEANAGDNLVLSYDPGSNKPALSIRCFFQDTPKVTAADETGQNLLLQAASLSPLVEVSNESSVGLIGNWGAPFSGAQFLINGAEHNSPLSRTILQEKIGYRTANRATVDDKAGYEFSAVVPDIPVIASSLNVLNLNFGHTDMCATVEMTATGTDASGAHFTTVGKFLVTCSSTGAIASVIVDAIFNGGTQMFFFQGIQVGGATSMVAGLFVWKNVNANVLNANIDFKITMGGSGGGGYSSTVTPQL